MANDNVIRLPIKYTQILKNKRGKYSVNCLITDRWLKFEDTSVRMDVGEAVILDVMETDTDGNDKKVCQLVVTKEELLEVIKQIEPLI
jgi:hypothetical protein